MTVDYHPQLHNGTLLKMQEKIEKYDKASPNYITITFAYQEYIE